MWNLHNHRIFPRIREYERWRQNRSPKNRNQPYGLSDQVVVNLFTYCDLPSVVRGHRAHIVTLKETKVFRLWSDCLAIPDCERAASITPVFVNRTVNIRPLACTCINLTCYSKTPATILHCGIPHISLVVRFPLPWSPLFAELSKSGYH